MGGGKRISVFVGDEFTADRFRRRWTRSARSTSRPRTAGGRCAFHANRLSRRRRPSPLTNIRFSAMMRSDLRANKGTSSGEAIRGATVVAARAHF